jgi:hypothetical protein
MTHAGERGHRAGGRIGAMVGGVAHERELVDVIEIVGFPLILYVAHLVDDTAKNCIEPNRTLLRPRLARRPNSG